MINWNDVEESLPIQEKYYLVKLVNNPRAKLTDKVLNFVKY